MLGVKLMLALSRWVADLVLPQSHTTAARLHPAQMAYSWADMRRRMLAYDHVSLQQCNMII